MRLYKVCGASFYEIFLPTELLNPLCCSPNSAPSPLLSCIYTHSFPSFPSPFFSFPSPSALTFAFGLCFLLLLRREEPGWCRLAWFGLVGLGCFPSSFLCTGSFASAWRSSLWASTWNRDPVTEFWRYWLAFATPVSAFVLA